MIRVQTNADGVYVMENVPAGDFLMMNGDFDDHVRCGGTLLTPVDRVLEIRYGTWSAATGGILPR